MKPVTYLSLSLLFAFLFVFSTTAMAAERNKERKPKANGEEKKKDEKKKEEKKRSEDKTVQASGEVLVTKENDRITALKIGEQEVSLDGLGKDLAMLMAGKSTSASGVVRDKELVLRSFTADLTGTVKVGNKDRKGEATSIKLVTDAGVQYVVALNQEGKDLAKMDGKKVDVSGTIGAKDGARMLQVDSAKEAVKKESKEKEKDKEPEKEQDK